MPFIFDEHVKGHTRAGMWVEELPNARRFKGGGKKAKTPAPPPPPPPPAPPPPEKTQTSLKIKESDAQGGNSGRSSLRIKRSGVANIDRTNSGVNLPISE